MSRMENKEVMGFYAIEPKHHAAILSLIQAATPEHKLLDPFAGEGEFLEVAAKHWNMSAYANELDGERAAKCIERFGPKQAVRCDVERLSASTGAFSLGWFNPPYDHDAAAKNSKRVEFRYLRHAWKWVQEGGIAMWCVYQQHLTEEALAFLAKNSQQVDVWGLPGKHLGEYSQVIVVAIKGLQANPNALYQALLQQREAPRLLSMQESPVYKLPKAPKLNRFIFAPDMVDEEQGLRLLNEQGAWKNQGFQTLLEIPPQPSDIVPPVAPRPGHTALVLAAGIADGAVIESAEHGLVAMRGKTRPVEVIARVEVEADARDPERQIKKTTIRLKPSTTLSLLAQDGTVIEMEGDDALLNFIRGHRQALAQYLNQRFKPLYKFNLNGLAPILERIKLKGKHSLYMAQRHVIAAMTRAFEERDSLLLIGQMGVGKTALGSTTAIAIGTGAVKALRSEMQANQVSLVIAPPHLIEKWKREILSIHPNAYVERLDRHEDVKTFMDKAARLGAGMPKIGLIKRDMTKLGCPRESAVVWRTVGRALWRYGEETPPGYLPEQRILREKIPYCPHCGAVVMQKSKESSQPASEAWLKAGKRDCEACHSPLWQDARDSGSKPKVGEKYPPKNPRMRLDEYIKRNYRDRVYLLIWDEAHEAAHGDTGNGESFGRLAGVAKKVLAMTGTPFNGRSSSLFNLEYHLNARVRQQYNWGGSRRLARKERGSRYFPEILQDNSKQRGRAESRWVDAMGVREQTVEERPTYDSETGAFTGTTTYQRPYEEAPGISPLLVAEVLDHALFFSLGDLNKGLPEYQEIALPVEADADVADLYDNTLKYLKDYLIKRRWEGDVSFRGAYLQWAMSWCNTAHMPYEIIHNLRDRFSNQKRSFTVKQMPSLGQERLYPKEEALIELVRDELANNRPCVIYVRQTQTRDLQPRLAELLKAHIPEAKPYILKNTVAAERREAVIEQQIKGGINMLITNPELTKTGLDLLFAPTLIFYEPTFNLSTMMQASARSYRLNQTHALCKVYFLFYEGTMEHHAVQLMSRKQRAAKLLNGEIGLTGLDALTENEGGLEEALMQAIGREESLIDPTQLFKTDNATSQIDAEDLLYWNVELPASSEPEMLFEAPAPQPTLLAEVKLQAQSAEIPKALSMAAVAASWTSLRNYVKTVSTLDEDKFARVEARILHVLECGQPEPMSFRGLNTSSFTQADEEALLRWLTKYLRSEKAVLREYSEQVAGELLRLAKQILLKPEPKLFILPKPQVIRRRNPDLMAVPEDVFTLPTTKSRSKTAKPRPVADAPQQLALF